MAKYTTSEFCRLCNVSRKQLLYYEERGLISNVERDKDNNYRYYSEKHIYEMVAAKALRNINMPVSEMQDIIFGKSLGSIRLSLWDHLENARENMEFSIQTYQQSLTEYARLSEALSYLTLKQKAPDILLEYEVVERAAQNVVFTEYTADWDDYGFEDVKQLPKIQTIAEEVNATSFGAVIYLTYDHFDSSIPEFNNEPHLYRIAIPVIDEKKKSNHYMVIPPIKGVSAIHVGTPKNRELATTYMGLFNWAKEQGYELENWSLEEWLISPMITNNSDLWVIRIVVPFKETRS